LSDFDSSPDASAGGDLFAPWFGLHIERAVLQRRVFGRNLRLRSAPGRE
ncbi:MAG: hypothetical protein QOD00_4099, partial [Blastocatellia bacterium]|nr:hypothetical protein [Blastocatellia bacterium]